MLGIVFWVCVGIFIGWNLEQPDWAKEFQDRVIGFVKGLTGK
jgi:hypothetical protein